MKVYTEFESWGSLGGSPKTGSERWFTVHFEAYEKSN